jgi:hypothetical protein
MLLSAYECAPGRGGESGEGWNWARELARFHDVWVVTRGRNREAIERALETEPLASAHFLYFDLPRWLVLPRSIHHFLWQLGAYVLCRDVHAQVSFETMHHLSPAGYRLPNFLPLLPVRFLWGADSATDRPAQTASMRLPVRAPEIAGEKVFGK